LQQPKGTEGQSEDTGLEAQPPGLGRERGKRWRPDTSTRHTWAQAETNQAEALKPGQTTRAAKISLLRTCKAVFPLEIRPFFATTPYGHFAKSAFQGPTGPKMCFLPPKLHFVRVTRGLRLKAICG
jgi:hypothetical protein